MFSGNGGIRVRFWAESRCYLTTTVFRASCQVCVVDITRGMKLVLKLSAV
jgi:hypothetical protein